MEEDFKDPILDALQTKCKSCGGVAEYSPADENLKCNYCGAIAELDKTAAVIKTNNFDYWKEKALEDNKSHDSVLEASEIRCRQCGATTTLPANTSAAKCAFCATPLILGEAHIKTFWQPEYLLPFKVSEKQCATNFKTWLGRRWFLPNKLKKYGVDTDTFKGVYQPFWAYDSETTTKYTGEKGINRTVHFTGSDGKRKTRTETDWHRVSGTVKQKFQDVFVPASNVLPAKISKQLTNWDMKNSVSYQKEFLAGFVTEIYQRDFVDSVGDAKKKMEQIIESKIRSDIGGDNQRVHSRQIHYDDLAFKLLLLPIWISAFQFNGKLYQFVVNGRTGQVIGEYPKSTAKIVLFVLMIILIIVAFAIFLNR